MDFLFDGSLGTGTLVLLILSLLIALGFEFANGFHDTANAVATVIYTKTLRPWTAVIWSGIWNFIGIFFGGVAVAYSIVNLLPVDLIASINSNAGMAMVLAMLLVAIIWNVGTWYFGLPASSSHTLIGSILGVGLANSFLREGDFTTGVNWGEAGKVMISLLISPLMGFSIAAGLLLLVRKLVKNPILFEDPQGKTPPFWVRAVLIFTCTGVSFAHGSNDGQKGIGLIMLILIGVLPGIYSINGEFSASQITATIANVQKAEVIFANYAANSPQNFGLTAATANETRDELVKLRTLLEGKSSLKDISKENRWQVRTEILKIDKVIDKMLKKYSSALPAQDAAELKACHTSIRGITNYAVMWVIVAVGLALGIGTTVGWKRIVVTVGQKIGKKHMTYAQGAIAESVAMTMIGFSSLIGLPVSTTHVLSSGIAGTMFANNSGLQKKTIRKIGLAWVFTLPAAITLSGGLFILFLSIAGLFTK